MKEKIGRITGLFLAGLMTVTALVFASCGDEPSQVCDPGSTQDCSCGGGRTGYQTCMYDGTAWDFCVCPCTPNCSGRECGVDPLCGTLNCGTCPAERPNCNPASGSCYSSGPDCPADRDCSGRECGPDPVCSVSCGTCSGSEECNASGVCVLDCVSNCSGRECGWDPVCGTLNCGTCSSPDTCNSSGRCACTPNCTGRECGSDPVCGTSCGSCLGSESCVSGRCETTVLCPNGRCDSGETCTTCPADCGAGDGCAPGSSGTCTNWCGSGSRRCDTGCRWEACVVTSGAATVRVAWDTYTNQANSTRNYCPTDTYLVAGINPTTFREYITFLEFNTADLDSIPDSPAAITRADLSLTIVTGSLSGAAPTVRVQQVTSGWTCSTITYASMPSWASSSYDSRTLSSGRVTYDLRGFVDYLRTAPVVDPSVVLAPDTGDIGIVSFYRRDGGVSAPKLEVSWTCP